MNPPIPTVRQVVRSSRDFDAIVLGPCPCIRCGTPLYWNGVIWNERQGGQRARHTCRGVKPPTLAPVRPLTEPEGLDPYREPNVPLHERVRRWSETQS